MMARASFVRESADTRRQALIDATARSLAELGVAGTSVRSICSRAGVSPGLLTHYFPGVDALIVATYRHTGAKVVEALAQAVEEAGDDPRARLNAYVTASFRPPLLDPELLATWIAFWSLIRTRPDMKAAHADHYGDFRVGMEKLVADCAPQLDAAAVRMSAVAITALVDGLWLELCLDPSSFPASDAVDVALRWVAELLR